MVRVFYTRQVLTGSADTMTTTTTANTKIVWRNFLYDYDCDYDYDYDYEFDIYLH